MAKKRKPPVRTGVACNFWISEELDAAVTSFIQSQDVPPLNAAVFRQALMEFLERRGFWPGKSEDKK